MHTKQWFSVVRDFFIKNSVKFLKVSSGNDVFLHNANEKIGSLKTISKKDNESFNGDDLTVESKYGI